MKYKDIIDIYFSMSEKTEYEVVSELSMAQLEKLIVSIDNSGDKMILLKFYADWCGPCKRVEDLCEEASQNIGDSVIKVVIDIDDQLDLYMFLKRKRIITGIPCTIAWHPQKDRDYEYWYSPNDSVLSSDRNDTIAFFKRQFDVATVLNASVQTPPGTVTK